VLAVEVAAPAAEGESQACGIKVEQGFFFDGVDCHRGYLAVVQDMEDAVLILAHLAQSKFLWPDDAAPLANVAANYGVA